MKNRITKEIIIRLILAIAALVFVILSMITGKLVPYLTISLCLSSICNLTSVRSCKNNKK